MQFPSKNTTVTLALVVAAFASNAMPSSALAQAQPQQAGKGTMPQNLMNARAALEKYQDPIAAVADGYLSTLVCMDFPHGGKDGSVEFKPGAMGVHFLNLGNIGPTLDTLKPQVLIYEPVGSKLRLAAAEWFVPVELVKGETPRIFGQELTGPMDGHAPIMPAGLRHYDLHVWLWKDNPAGVFNSTNPAVKCGGSGYSHSEMPHHKP
jgi:hypothetical protein